MYLRFAGTFAGDLAGVGSCMDHYWELKKKMAPGCEPVAVSAMMKKLRPFVHGVCLAGAGGGGFMYVLTKQPNSLQLIKEQLSDIEVCMHGCTFSFICYYKSIIKCL